MGDSEEGGGGSVHWRLEAKDAKNASHNHVDKKVDQEGDDNDGAVGTDFTVSVLMPRDFPGGRGAFLTHLQSLLMPSKDKERVFFNLPIEDKRPAQIRVSWGKSEHHEGTMEKRPTTT